MPWLPARWKHYGHAWVPVEEPMPPRAEWCPWSELWLETMLMSMIYVVACWYGQGSFFLLLLLCFAFVCLFLQWHQWLRITSAMKNINGFWDNCPSLPSQKRISLNRKLLTSVLKIVIKTMKGCSSQLMASGDRVGRTQVSLRGFFKGHWECDHVLMSIRATQIWLFFKGKEGRVDVGGMRGKTSVVS